MGQRYGVDVSSNNVRPINWPALYTYLKNLGSGAVPFVIVKITEATNYVNSDDAADVASARSAGFVVAGYLFDHGNVDPTQEVNYFEAHSMGLPLFDDIEDAAGLTSAQYAAHAQQLMAIPSSQLEYLNQSEVAQGFPHDRLWLAEYNNAPGSTAYPCLIHQYADQATVPMCSGTFDLNVWLGTEAQFAQFFALPAPVTQTSPLSTRKGQPMPAACIIGSGLHEFTVDQTGRLIHRWYDTAVKPQPGWQHEILASGCDASRGPLVTAFGGTTGYHVFADRPDGSQVHLWWTVGVSTSWGTEILQAA